MSSRTIGFIERHSLWTAAQKDAAEDVRKAIAGERIESVRVAFADQHGILRGKTYTSRAFESVLVEGCAITSTLLLKDTSRRTAFPIWRKDGGLDPARLIGASDFILVPDPATFRPIPWAKKSAWILCDAYYHDGTAVPFSTRHLLRKVLSGLEGLGYAYLSGIELEFSVYRLVDAQLTHESCTHPGRPPEVRPLTHGYQHLTEGRCDELEPVPEILREVLVALGLPLRTLEVEFGPSQMELTFDPVVGIEGADQLPLTRSAIKQVCKRHGYQATFMTRPAFANAFSSGWHLHQSLLDARNSGNIFASEEPGELLSPIGRSFLAGLLAHAKEACLLSTPTINGYNRYSRSHSLAPKSHRLGQGQSWRHAASRGCSGRQKESHREPHWRACGESLSLLCVADHLRRGWHAASPGSAGGCRHAIR